MVLNHAETERVTSFAAEQETAIVVVQGLGFVGTAMTAALVGARRPDGAPCFSVIGVDLDNEHGRRRIEKINQAQPAVLSSDEKIDEAIREGWVEGRLLATSSKTAYAVADIVVVDINLDVEKKYVEDRLKYSVDLSTYEEAIEDVARHVREEVLVVIESTVPPGMTEKVIYPIFERVFTERALDVENFSLVHSYERVMPGANYLKSITDYYRVFAGMSPSASDKARAFFEQFINVKDFPLTELEAPRASELSKVLENSYRAMNIAFIQEWTEFAEEAGVNLFDVLRAIKKRSTHNNIMAPGFGVGGYCLTKDSLLADWARTSLFDSRSHLEMSVAAVETNDRMPMHTFRLLKEAVGDLNGKTIALLGVSYLNDVADTRHSPAGPFYDACIAGEAEVLLHDTFVFFWDEKAAHVETDLQKLSLGSPQIVIFTVRHSEYLRLEAEELFQLFPHTELIIDANNLISDEKAAVLRSRGLRVLGVGKGHWEL